MSLTAAEQTRLTRGVLQHSVAKLYRDQICQIVTELPALAGWLFRTQTASESPVPISYAKLPRQDLDATILQQLETGIRVATKTYKAGLNELQLDDQSPLGLYQFGQVGQETPDQQPSYLLLWLSQPLSTAQSAWLSQATQGMQTILLMEQQLQVQASLLQQFQQGLQRIRHQFRNPLAVINLYAENVRRGTPDQATQTYARQ
ncbi:MAG: hypothetical protein AAGF24_09125, partial [Cyanobacteria bacterium P01_H01_bin.121]